MKIENCGISALGKINPVSKISAYSLIQMAKDNGLNLLIYQVDVKDLVSVPRPAIFHSNDHFLYVKNGEALPKDAFTGFVLAEKGYKGARIVTYAEAKRITGSKKGGVARFIVPAVLSLVTFGAAGIIGGAGSALASAAPALAAGVGAVSNTGMDQYAKSNHPEQLGPPGNLLDIFKSTITGGLTGIAGAGGIAGATAAPAGLASKAAGFAKGAFNAISHPIASLDPANLAGGANVAGPAVAGAAGYGAGTPAGVYNTGQVSLLPNATAAAGGVNNAAGMASLSQYVNNPATSAGFSLRGAVSGAGNIASSNMDSNLLALGASQFGKPDTSGLPTLGNQTAQDYSTLKSYLGSSPLAQPSQEQLLKYVNTPLDQLTSQMSFNADPVVAQINKSFDQQVQQATRIFAQSGQSFDNSTDARNELGRINNDRATAIKNATSELQNQALSQAIQAKQFALANGLQQNQFDMQLAMDLATLNGQGKALQTSIQAGNYNNFQNIIANLLHIGYQQNQPVPG